MTRYLLSVHSGAGEGRAPMTQEEMQESHRQLRAIESDMAFKGMGYVFAAIFYGDIVDWALTLRSGRTGRSTSPWPTGIIDGAQFTVTSRPGH